MALAAPSPGRLAVTTADLAMSDAQERAVARRHSISTRSRSLCEDLAEHLSWLQFPDDADRVAEVIRAVQDDSAALRL